MLGWSLDGLAAGLLGAAVGASALLLGHGLPGVAAAAAVSLAALALLRQVRPEPRRFRMRSFDLISPPVETVPGDVLDLTEIAGDEALLLEDRLEPAPLDSRVVQLFAARPLPTPGELRQRIEAHLGERPESRGGTVLELEVDATAALRQALGELRRNLA